MTLNEFSSHQYVINLSRRKDRLEQFTAECVKHGIRGVERFDAYDGTGWYGGAHSGCTNSHRGVLELARHAKYPVVTVYEDDAQVCVGNIDQVVTEALACVPSDWEILYWGAHFASDLKSRANKYWVRVDRVFTTSSYSMKYETVCKIAPSICGVGPIDVLYGGFTSDKIVGYCITPRVFIQRTGHSDILGHEVRQDFAMLDMRHLNKLDGK